MTTVLAIVLWAAMTFRLRFLLLCLVLAFLLAAAT
jgi:hypothetical protein